MSGKSGLPLGGELYVSVKVTHLHLHLLLRWALTLANRIQRSRKVKIAIRKIYLKSNPKMGWTVGNLERGDSFTGKPERSFAVKLYCYDSDQFDALAMELAHDFKQESILIQDMNSNRCRYVLGMWCHTCQSQV